MKIFGRDRQTELEQPRTGTPIRTADGVTLGVIGEVRGGYFEIAQDMPAMRFWLSSAYIRRIHVNRAELTLDARDIDAHRLAEPGLTTLPDVHDQVLSDEEALAQRERMERELRKQRGTIDTGRQ
jgi:hypothetical protein